VLHVALVYMLVRAFWMVSERPWAGRSAAIETLLKIALWVIPCLLVLAIAARQSPRAAWRDLGLRGSPWRAVGFALAATLPMALALALTPVISPDFDLLLDSAVVGPFAEEVLFRGFLCLQLVYRAGWRIGSAIIVSSAMFALAHLPHIDLWLFSVLLGPGSSGLQAAGGADGFAIIVLSPAEVWSSTIAHRADDLLLYGAPYALGGALFAWIAWRWQSLWPAVALHACVNLWWVLAQGESRLLFDITPMSLAHGLAIVLAIGLTLRLRRGESGQLADVDDPGAGAWNRFARSDGI
jgi:membrane protease YdiL (CAAX protease family)